MLRKTLYAVMVFVGTVVYGLAEEKPLCVASTGLWAPFNHFDASGRLVGIGIDYWQAIAKEANLSFRYDIKRSWQEVLTSIREKRCDVTVATHKTPSRLHYARFSVPYASYPVVIVTRMDVGFIDDLKQIADKTIVVPRSYATTEMVRKHYPGLTFRYVDNIDEALEAVSSHDAYATVGVLPVVAYKITKKLNNLKISGKTPFRFDVSVMVRDDKPQLLARINRAVAALEPQVRDAIYHKWIHYPLSRRIDYRRWFIAAVSIASVILAGLLFYIVRLKKDAQSKEKKERMWRKIAHIDQLTGVHSRRYALEYFRGMLRRARREGASFGIVFFDVDYLKRINDRFGHEAGDRVLKDVAHAVRRCLGAEDVIGRWGGDEFIVIVPDKNEEEIVRLVATMKEAVSRLDTLGEEPVSSSFGYAIYTQGDSKRTMFERADKMLYANKSARKR